MSFSMSKRLYRIIGILATTWLLTAMACAPAAAPAQPTLPPKATTAPATKPTESSAAKPAATASPAAKPASSPAAQPKASTDWQAEWDKVVAAAKKEGKVVVAGGPGEMYRNAAMPFQKAYPDIQLEFSGAATTPNIPRFLSEREGGQYLWDVFVGATPPMLTALKPAGTFDPLKPALLLPDIADESKWMDGFQSAFMDKEGQFVFDFQLEADPNAHVNRDMIKESELSKIDQLLDPQWKGKIVIRDARVLGKANAQVVTFLKLKGEDWVRKLLSQDLVVVPDARPQAEALVRGEYPIGLGVDTDQIHTFEQQGVWPNMKVLEPDNVVGTMPSTGFGNVGLFNRAPHPNAAKVYLNWLLSKEGQQAYVAATALNSRRLDVGGPPETAPNPQFKSAFIYNEETLPLFEKATAISKEYLK